MNTIPIISKFKVYISVLLMQVIDFKLKQVNYYDSLGIRNEDAYWRETGLLTLQWVQWLILVKITFNTLKSKSYKTWYLKGILTTIIVLCFFLSLIN